MIEIREVLRLWLLCLSLLAAALLSMQRAVPAHDRAPANCRCIRGKKRTPLQRRQSARGGWAASTLRWRWSMAARTNSHFSNRIVRGCPIQISEIQRISKQEQTT
jgi:hypothetical protein